MPLLMVYASYALVHPRDLRQLVGPRRLAGPLLVLLFFFGVCVPHFFRVARKIWFHVAA